MFGFSLSLSHELGEPLSLVILTHWLHVGILPKVTRIFTIPIWVSVHDMTSFLWACRLVYSRMLLCYMTCVVTAVYTLHLITLAVRLTVIANYVSFTKHCYCSYFALWYTFASNCSPTGVSLWRTMASPIWCLCLVSSTVRRLDGVILYETIARNLYLNDWLFLLQCTMTVGKVVTHIYSDYIYIVEWIWWMRQLMAISSIVGIGIAYMENSWYVKLLI